MKLLLFLILIINLLIIVNGKLQGKIYKYNIHKDDWEVELGNLPGSSSKFENQKPNFLYKTIVDPLSFVALKFEINDNEKKDVKISCNGGTSHWTFKDKFGSIKPDDVISHNYMSKTYCAKDNFNPYYFNFTCENQVFPCSVSARIDFGDMKGC
ncbi:hypothetical protein ACTFIZ_008574 [Dictyostelium cf. discoideum]